MSQSTYPSIDPETSLVSAWLGTELLAARHDYDIDAVHREAIGVLVNRGVSPEQRIQIRRRHGYTRDGRPNWKHVCFRPEARR